MGKSISRVQAPVQDFLRPAVWVPGLRNPHCYKEIWKLQSDSNKDNLEAILRSVTKAFDDLDSGFYWEVRKNELQIARGFLRVFVYTRAKWLDIIEITLKGKTIEIWSFSSGLLPLSIPLACIINVAFFWVPFFDSGMNKSRIDMIVARMEKDVERWPIGCCTKGIDD